MKHVIAIVVTSEKTWELCKKYLFDEGFLKNRTFFDLAIVCNGYDEHANAYLSSFSPDYLFFRENKGYDIAALDHAIKNVPSYPHYLFLHEDNWFKDFAWFERLDLLQMSNPNIDIFGNLATNELLHGFDDILSNNNVSFRQSDFPYFLQGYTGWYRGPVIDCFLKIGGIPGYDQKSRFATHFFERFTSFILLNAGFRLGQIPPGYEQYLMHSDFQTTSDRVHRKHADDLQDVPAAY